MSNNGFASGVIEQLLLTRVPKSLSWGECALLRRLAVEDDRWNEPKGHDDIEQLTRFVPGGWWFRDERVSAQTCFRLIKHCLISMDGEESGGVSYWRVNDMGRMVANGATIEEAHGSSK